METRDKILIVEDDETIAAFLVAVLNANGFDTIRASLGKEAVSLISSHCPDLVLLDLSLPDMDGTEILTGLRKWSTLPVIVVSARGRERDKVIALDMGADDYITKPIDEEEMLLRIRALLRRAKIVSERRIEMGEVVLDYDAMTVTGHGQVQVLPQKEFLLLYKLLSYPGKIFTRIQLMDEIWGIESDSGWETLTVHIGRLRRRFEGWEEFSIESVRGLGYKAVKKV